MIVSRHPRSARVYPIRGDAMRRLTLCHAASLPIAVLAALAAALGVAYEGTYHNTAFARAAFRGTDLVTLVVVLPGLAASAYLAKRGSHRAHLLWLGALGYRTFTYAYVFAMGFSRLFLL